MPSSSDADRPNPIFLQDPALNQSVKEQIRALGRRWPLARIAEIVEANFAVKVSRAEIIAVCNERSAPKPLAAPEPEEHRADKETVHPADAPRDCLLTPPPASSEPASPPFSIVTGAPPTRTGPGQENDPPEPIAAAAPPQPQADAPTRTGPGQEKDPPELTAAAAPPQPQADTATRTGPGPETAPHEILPTEVREFIIGRMARRQVPWLIADEVRRKFGFEVDHDEIVVCWRDRDAPMTEAEPEPEKASRPRLSDEVKTFIVKRIACYEKPSRIAAAVRINFGIDIDRRRIFDYDPKGSRPPAQRWIDLHDATRAQFLRDTAEIGIAQKVIRLKALDRMAEMAEDNHQLDKAARYLQQAARECGGFYERHPRPQAAAEGAQV